ncbi:methyl-accepting chemotaxis protein [Thioalkalivibrio sp. ALJ16]|uniref:methyl-accepting chemotaxis protein n=1 Tax=Thioalkalivibrio sp. ALJ16 TaxID=1158762 RepID=UPI00039A25AB|nr:HAMP domain-containing methyl-accepting chemotaxis protein [Thioalkalivibrio sp. ALJ16]
MEQIRGLSRLSLAGRFSLALSAIVGMFFLIAAVAVFWHTATLKAGMEDTLAGVMQGHATTAALETEVTAEVERLLTLAAWQVNAMMLGVAIGVVAVVYVLFVLMIRRRLAGLAGQFRKVSEGEGDLRQRIEAPRNDGIDRLARLFNAFIERLQTMVSEMVEHAGELGDSAGTLHRVAQETNQEVRQQQARLGQVATAMNQVSASAEEIARNAHTASEAADQAEEQTRTGSQVVDGTVRTMRELASDIAAANEQVATLQAESEGIGSVLDVIRGIAEQTNLLALNAAIEAARAGEQGRGFAVVADEVRTLATRTQDSTTEIQAMIERLQAGARTAATAMERSREKGASGVDEAARAGEALQAIQSAVERIRGLNNEISAAVSQQAAVAREVDGTLTEVSQGAEVTAANAEATASETDALVGRVERLRGLTTQFRV